MELAQNTNWILPEICEESSLMKVDILLISWVPVVFVTKMDGKRAENSVCYGKVFVLGSLLNCRQPIVAVGTEKPSTFVQGDSTDHNDVLITRIAEGNWNIWKFLKERCLHYQAFSPSLYNGTFCWTLQMT